MARMFHDLEEDVVRARIRKFRDESLHPSNRLAKAASLVDLVERMLDAGPEDVASEPETLPDPQPDENPEEDTEPAQRSGLFGKIFPG